MVDGRQRRDERDGVFREELLDRVRLYRAVAVREELNGGGLTVGPITAGHERWALELSGACPRPRPGTVGYKNSSRQPCRSGRWLSIARHDSIAAMLGSLL